MKIKIYMKSGNVIIVECEEADFEVIYLAIRNKSVLTWDNYIVLTSNIDYMETLKHE